MGSLQSEYVLTVMASDRVGIIRDVSSALASMGGNITHLSQTVLRGYFTLIISVALPGDVHADQLRSEVEARGGPGELGVLIRPFEGFAGTEDISSARYVLTMRGKDQPGIIARTTAYLAANSINIVDFYSYVHESILLMLAQVLVPPSVDLGRVQEGLQGVGSDFGLAVHFQHENIFRATSDVRPVQELQ
jgi:glycine cleavage system transcriptional repressor